MPVGEGCEQSGLSVGLVHNWPGKKNSELDLIGRMQPILRNLGHRPSLVDPIGFVLDDEGCRTRERIIDDQLDLVLNLHYLNPKMFGRLSYVVNWNPLRYLVGDPATGQSLRAADMEHNFNCFRSHDRVLTAGSDELDDAIAQVRRSSGKGNDLPTADLPLNPTVSARFARAQVSGIGCPDAEEAKVFYIGINWEKLASPAIGNQRHAGLFRLLDDSGEFRFFGLEKQNGFPLWEGIASYQGHLPFDQGRSILRESARCGISLVLSSNQHIDSAVVSTRIFQAIAAGTIVISDRNSFVERHFGDCCYFFDYGRDARETCSNILDCIEQVRADWKQARARAEKAHQILGHCFDLEKQLENICVQAEHDLETRKKSLQQLASRSVAVHYLARRTDEAEIAELAENLRGQDHKNWQLHVYSPMGSRSVLEELLDASGVRAEVHDLPGTRISIGQTLMNASECRVDFHIWYSPRFEWSTDHISQLMLAAGGRRGVGVAPLFRNHLRLETRADPTAYLVDGLRDCHAWLNGSSHDRPGLYNLAAGNIMLASSVVSGFTVLTPPLHFFDLLSLAILAARCGGEETGEIGYSSAVTSRLKTADDMLESRYFEYQYMPPEYSDGEARDLHFFEVLQRPESRTPQFLEREYTEHVAVGEAGFYADCRQDSDCIDYISRHFSLRYYLANLFRNRPTVVRLINRSYAVLARLSRSEK